MATIPRDRLPDATLALLRDPYGFIASRCARHGSDVVATRLMGRPALVMRGEDAARLLYDEGRFSRADAAPRRLRRTLFGEGGVQGMDGPAHRHRKGLFTALNEPAEVLRLAEIAGARWDERIARWERAGRVVLHDEVAELHCEAVCAWAGVPLSPAHAARRARDLTAMIEAPAAVGPAYVRGRLARIRSERWCARMVRAVRRGALDAPAGGALHAVATHQDLDGRPLPEQIAAVELLNVLRPTVAVARFVIHCALALHEHPESREAVREGGPRAIAPFVQEVRRRAPFFPLVAARVREGFTWRGHRFPEGRRVLLDLHGTDHDARLWDEPGRFRPERFAGRDPGPFDLIPQGGGDSHTGHRCPGEPIAIALMGVALEALTGRMRYAVPPQDLRLGRRAPALPASGFVIADVRRPGPAPDGRPGTGTAG